MPVMDERQHSFEVTEQKIAWRSLTIKGRVTVIVFILLGLVVKLCLLGFLAAIIYWIVR
jgi:hypothetical protein